jgi:hypothetical protein
VKIIISIFLLLTVTALHAAADGIPFKKFRSSRLAVPSTLLTLTQEQLASLATTNRFITLTAAQRIQLQQAAPYTPERLEVYPLDDAKGTCTCEVLNIGIRYTRTRIEVPHGLLGRTLEDRKMWKR